MFSHSGHVMTLANSIIGVGILAMPFCFQKCGIILATLLLIVNNLMTRLCCHYLIKTSLLTRRRSLEFLGLHAFGPSGKLLAELCTIGYLIGSCITYFVVVGDLGPQIISKMFALDGEQQHLRTIIMLVVTVLCVLPLGMLRNVDSLSALSTASIGFYVCLMLKVMLESLGHIITADWTDKVIYWEPAGILQCLPIFSMALSCQMQIFEVFGSINNQSLDKLNGIVRNATWLCTLVYIAVGFFGYVAFCTQTFSGNILINLTPSFGSDIIKIGFVLSIAFSFPLVIFPCRASIFSLLYRKGLMDSSSFIPEPRFRAITIFIVGISMCIALVIPSIELVIGLVGSTIGVAICIMFPAASFRRIIKKESNERLLAQFIFIGGFCLMVLGTFANLNAIDEQSSGAHKELTNIEHILRQPATPLAAVDQIAQIEAKLKQAELAQGNENNLSKASKIDLVDKEKVEAVSLKPNEQQVPLPPLPVDESHVGQNDKPKTAAEKVAEIEARLKAADAAKKKPVNESEETPKKPMAAITEEAIKILPEQVTNTPPPVILPHINETHAKLNVEKLNAEKKESIDKAAIKKEDEIVAEEQKEQKSQKVNEDELKKTQNELKKTKELLERTVDELKVELAKQNQETQDFVAEKLNVVVEKVEQIERQVQNKDEAAAKPEAAAAAKEHTQIKGKLLNMLAAPAPLPAAVVYEPESYKTGELMTNKTKNKLNSMLPLPLVLMQTKQNESKTAPPPPPAPAPSAVNQTNAKEKEIPSNLTQNSEDKSTEQQNVDAIRRDLLHIKVSSGDASETTTGPLRLRRAVDAAPNENCLTEPKLSVVSAPAGAAAAIVSQIENIGRDLKSFKETEDALEQAVQS